ncbi:PilZ domain-containing protein [Clostridium sp. AL.422]|uniref:flagellar brake protein n=1 Tax=Clostridium TaxID=1485 RepID=UPI00293DF3FF|nr:MULTISPECIES: flagellar brake domain-containing protein [unclassified Clostridium]MDV4149686.1 PilZ domain-containing protein [Clostridium sp. AL.422]
MVDLNITINSRVTILWEESMYKSNIQDINEKEILITIPVYDGIYLTLSKGDEIEQIFYDKKGNLFTYKTKVLGRYIEKKIPFYRLNKPYDIKRVQRRDYVRVNIVQIISYLKETDLEIDIKGKDNCENALLLDLSGGGMKIKVKEELSVNDTIISNLTYDSEKISVKGRVVRIEKTEDRKYIYGINFDDIDNSTREKIIKTVFKIMRKQRELV